MFRFWLRKNKKAPASAGALKRYLRIFFHPDFTVGSGITPDHTFRLAGFTAGRESHPALKIYYIYSLYYFIVPVNYSLNILVEFSSSSASLLSLTNKSAISCNAASCSCEDALTCSEAAAVSVETPETPLII